MDCGFDKDLVQEFAIGEITSEERRQVTEHLAGCADCRAEVASLRQLARDLAALPDPPFPEALEEVLIRSSIQAGQAARPQSAPAPVRPSLRPAWALFFGGLAGVAILTLLIVLLWPGRFAPMGSANQVVGGGQGLGLLDSLMRWMQDLQTGWNTLRDFLDKFSPVGRAIRIALSGVGGSIWAALALGAIGATLLLWRVTRAGQKKMRSLGDANPQ